jgi:hypothetical protein
MAKRMTSGGVREYACAFPSPRPSPVGRGRIARRVVRFRASSVRRSFAERIVAEKLSRATEYSATLHLCSLSQRERVRVRENHRIEWVNAA